MMAGYVDFYEKEISDDFVFSNPMNFFPRLGEYVKLFTENGDGPICAGKVSAVSWDIPLDSFLNERINVLLDTSSQPPENASFRAQTEPEDPSSLVEQGFAMFGGNPDVFLMTFYADNYKTEVAAIVGSTPPAANDHFRFLVDEQVIEYGGIELVWMIVEGGYGSEIAIRVEK